MTRDKQLSSPGLNINAKMFLFLIFYKNETQFIRESMTYIAKTCSKSKNFSSDSECNFLFLFEIHRMSENICSCAYN